MDFEKIMAFNSPYNQQNMNSLIEKIRSKCIVPYIGAGMSVLFDNVYPSWSDFLNSSFQKYFKVNDKAYYDSLNYEEKATFLYSEMGELTFSDRLKEVFGDNHINREAINFVHKSVYILPVIFENGLLITTNYDKVIEKMYLLHEKVLTVTHPGHYEALNGALRDGNLVLYKIHGDIVEPITSIILTKEQYETAYANPSLIQALKQAYTSKEMLFLGCSMTKDRPIELLCQNSQAGMKNYAIIPCDDKHVKDRRLQLENEYFTQAIIYPEGRHECLKELLHYIAKNTNPQSYQKVMKKHLDKNELQTGKLWIRSDTGKAVLPNELIKYGDNAMQLDGNVTRADIKMPDGKTMYAEVDVKRKTGSNITTDGYPQEYFLEIPQSIIVNKQEGDIIFKGIECRIEKYVLKFGGYFIAIYDKISGELQECSGKAPAGMTIIQDVTNKLVRIVDDNVITFNVPTDKER